MGQFIIVIPPNVPYDMLLGSEKQFATKLRKEIPMGAISIATYIKKYYMDWTYHIINATIFEPLKYVDFAEKFSVSRLP